MGLPEDELDRLSRLGRRRTFARGSALCWEGDLTDDVYLIREGLVRIVMSPPSGRELILSTRSAGELVGEMSAFDGLPRSASVIASEPTTVSVIAAPEFRRTVEEHPALSSYFLQQLSRALRATGGRAVAGVSDDVATRVVRRLVALADATAEHANGSVGGISLAVRQADLASWVGASREAVARELGALRRAGLVSTGRGHIDLLDVSALRTAG